MTPTTFYSLYVLEYIEPGEVKSDESESSS